jgi:hypothetical protein
MEIIILINNKILINKTIAVQQQIITLHYYYIYQISKHKYWYY